MTPDGFRSTISSVLLSEHVSRSEMLPNIKSCINVIDVFNDYFKFPKLFPFIVNNYHIMLVTNIF